MEEEIGRAWLRCDPGALAHPALTFAPVPTAHAPGVWTRWLSQIFDGILVGPMLAAMEATHSEHAREVVASDAAIARALPASAVARTCRAGSELLMHFSGLRGSRTVSRLAGLALEGKTPGTHAIAFAVRGALYHVSPRLILLAYARAEWLGGMRFAELRESPFSAIAALDEAALVIDHRVRPTLIETFPVEVRAP